MLKSNIAAIILSAFLFISCSKEISDEPSQRTAVTDSSSIGLLHKMVVTYLPENFENTVVEYLYDNTGRPISRIATFKIKEANGSITTKTDLRKFHRDNEGKIIRIGELTDTVYLLVEYENSSSKVKKISDNRDRFYTEFVYDANNRIEKLNFYQRTPATTDPYKLVSFHTHKFDSDGNMLEKIFNQDDDNNGTWEKPLKVYFSYDNRTNPVYHVDDALFPENWSLNSPNNTVRQINEYIGFPYRDTLNYTFTYDSQDRPATCTKDNESETKFIYY
ncbi:hypothetical protein [Pollutibacter soli]|uniref:hypothetical protein n=1 Tax=Pollutibacter soli TaxID=3034157 RepID=UPI0030136234